MDRRPPTHAHWCPNARHPRIQSISAYERDDGGMAVEIMVTVKAYPVIGKKIGEAVCVAGIRTDTPDPTWVRLFPVPYRDMPSGQHFKKYDVISVEGEPSPKDKRPESIRPNVDTLKKVGEIDAKQNWSKRYRYIEPLVISSMCEMRRLERDEGRSLGVFRPKEVHELVIERGEEQWGPKQLGTTQQISLLTPDKDALEKIPFTFKYHYRCDDPHCRGHTQSIIDWEIAQAWRKWRREYASEAKALEAIKHKWLETLCAPDRDTHFFVGNQHLHRESFLVLGVFWPKKSTDPQPSLFDPSPGRPPR